MQSGLWVPCDPVEGAITVNIGDALQYWSDGQLRSTYHRVRMPRADENQASRCSSLAANQTGQTAADTSAVLALQIRAVYDFPCLRACLTPFDNHQLTDRLVAYTVLCSDSYDTVHSTFK